MSTVGSRIRLVGRRICSWTIALIRIWCDDVLLLRGDQQAAAMEARLPMGGATVHALPAAPGWGARRRGARANA
jgi:hypothetical protein